MDFQLGVLSELGALSLKTVAEPPHRPWAAGSFAGCGFAGHSSSRGPQGARGGRTWDPGIAGPPVHTSTGPGPLDGDKGDSRMRWNGLARPR